MIIIFDVETTGLPKVPGSPLESQPHIIELAAIKTDNDFYEVERLEFLVNPGVKLEGIITQITGIKDEDLADKGSFIDRYEQLCTFFLGADTLIAHNMKFDLLLLKFELKRIDKHFAFPWPYKQLCTIEKTMHLKGYRLNLANLHFEMFGETPINNAHRAMTDAETLVKCCLKLRERNII